MTRLYASGEEPRIGDVVRRSLPGCLNVGDVYEVAATRNAGGALVVKGHGDFEYETYRFTLIARAGEAVKFQPGDVVEGIREALNGAILKGERYTLHDNWLPTPGFIDSFGMWRSAHVSATLVVPNLRLVHRPDAAKIDPVFQGFVNVLAQAEDQPRQGETLTRETAKLLRPGDLVRSENDVVDRRKKGDLIYIVDSKSSITDTVWYASALDGRHVNGTPSGFTFLGRPDADGWVPWGGGECLLANYAMVEVKLRGGATLGPCSAAAVRWTHPAFSQGDQGDIVAFRLVTEKPAAQQPPAPTTAEIADSLRHGDRVRFVVESTVDYSDSDPQPVAGWWLFSDADILAGTIEILERAPEPPVGQLTTTEGLLPGDVLVCTTRGLGIFGDEVTVRGVEGGSLVRTSVGLYHPSHFQFVRRPG